MIGEKNWNHVLSFKNSIAIQAFFFGMKMVFSLADLYWNTWYSDVDAHEQTVHFAVVLSYPNIAELPFSIWERILKRRKKSSQKKKKKKKKKKSE